MSEAPRNEQQRVSAPDFLRRVIDGAFEGASPLEPRLPSLFEPQTVAIAAAVAWPAELAGRDEEHAAPARVDDRPGREHHLPTVPSAPRAPRDSARADIDPPNVHRGRTPAEPASAVKSHHEPEAASVPPVRLRARPPEQEPERNVLTPKSLPMTSGVLLAQKVILTTETIHGPTVVRTPESREASLASIERPEYLQDRPVLPAPETQRIVVEPPTVRHRPEREPLHAAVVSPGPEPVVNVTIGRIEVRAVPAQPGSTRQRSQGPKPMSLDDYLKQRGGGR